jgi:hypothetical protein
MYQAASQPAITAVFIRTGCPRARDSEKRRRRRRICPRGCWGIGGVNRTRSENRAFGWLLVMLDSPETRVKPTEIPSCASAPSRSRHEGRGTPWIHGLCAFQSVSYRRLLGSARRERGAPQNVSPVLPPHGSVKRSAQPVLWTFPDRFTPPKMGFRGPILTFRPRF